MDDEQDCPDFFSDNFDATLPDLPPTPAQRRRFAGLGAVDYQGVFEEDEGLPN